MVTNSLSERCGAGPGRFKACWITADPFIVSSIMVKMVVRMVALSSICSTLLVCLEWLQTEGYYHSHSLSATRTKRICKPSYESVSRMCVCMMKDREYLGKSVLTSDKSSTSSTRTSVRELSARLF